MRGAVAAGHERTAEAGARILAEGGNAVDGCVAAALVAWVAESPLTGPGGAGFLLVHRARDRRDFLLDFFAAVPGRGAPPGPAAAMDEVEVPFGGDTTQTFLVGPASCAVPGMVAGLAEAHARYGTMPWAELFAPAIELARSGLAVNADQAFLHAILDRVLRRDPDGRRIYGEDGLLAAGATLRMPQLAETLQLLAAEGADAFYRGELARSIVEATASRGGRITVDDLSSYRVISRRPIRVAYRGHGFVSNPPPSAGGVLIAFALGILDRLGPGGSPGSEGALLRLAEVAREATLARGGSFDRGLERGGLRGRLLDPGRLDQAAAAVAERERSAARATPRHRSLPSTTHISVVDARGNAASLSSSTGCGSGVLVPGTGIQLNNMLGERDLVPSGRELAPGRRLTSMMSPSLLIRDGRPRVVVGSAGSERLRGAILQVVQNVVEYGDTVREAIDRPRCHLDGDELHLEAGLPADVAERLETRGYPVIRWPGVEPNLFFGGVSAVSLGPDGSLEAAGDPRRGGHGVVVSA